MVNQFTVSKVPYDKSLEFLYPEYSLEWSKNNSITPNLVYAHSGKKYLWICKEGHEWYLSPNHRTQGVQCNVCRGLVLISGVNDLKTRYPKLSLEFDEEINGIEMNKASSLSKKRYLWKCSMGHIWEDTVSHRVNDNTHCPTCSGRIVLKGFNDLEFLFPIIASEWNYEKNNLKPSEVTAKSRTSVWWKCINGHEWKTRVAARTQGRGCKDCSNKGTSEQERILFNYFSKNGFEVLKNKYLPANVSYTKRNKIEYDLVFPELKTVIEYDGNHWHSKNDSIFKDRERSFNLLRRKWKVIRIRDKNLESLNIKNSNYLEIFVAGHLIYENLNLIMEKFNEFV